LCGNDAQRGRKRQKKLDKMTNEQKLNYWDIRYNEINEKQTLLREKNAEYNNEL